MAYDKLSFLSGVAAGRNMESWPAFEGSSGSVFTWSIDISYLDTLDYFVWLNPSYIPGNAVTVDWGDGSFETFATPVHAEKYYHTYDSDGIYRIIVYGIYSCALDLFADEEVRECVISIDSPITFPDETEVERKHSYDLGLTGFYHLKTIARGILKNVSRCGFLFGGANFRNCYELETVPEDLLDYIDPNLLAEYGTGPVLCGFINCRALREIPKRLFSRSELWSQVLGVYEIFSGCSSLQTIPEGLFSALINCADFRRCFYGCTALASIQDDVFSGCREATTFESAFQGCSNLRDIGYGVFSGCSSVQTFHSCFEGCSNLTTLPSDLFDGCYGVTDMSRCFSQSGIQEIPAGLFSSLHRVNSYSECFVLCISLATVPFDLFDSNTETEVDFYNCFNGCSAITSAVPELWVKYPNTPYAKRYHCYYRCTSAANYSSIPDLNTPFPPGAWR